MSVLSFREKMEIDIFLSYATLTLQVRKEELITKDPNNFEYLKKVNNLYCKFV